RFSLFMLLPAPRSPLFPYTTLFRSSTPIRSIGRLQRRVRRLTSLWRWNCTRPAGSPPSAWTISAPRGQERTRIVGRRRGQSVSRSEEHTSELQSRGHLVCRLLLEKK